MEGRRNEIQVGIVTVVSLLVLFVGMLWLDRISVNRGSNMYQFDFPTVEGLQVGDRIQVRGIRAGQVEGFEIMQDFVRVRVHVDDEVVLAEDAVVTLGTKGIVGEVVIEVMPGEGRPVDEGHIFEGRTAASITQMTDAAGAALDAFESLTTKLDSLMGDILAQGRVVETMTVTREAVGNLNALLAENREATAGVMTNLRSASADLRELMDSGRIEQAFDDASRAAARLDTLTIALQSSARALDEIAAKLNEGEGTAARLLNDPTLYEQTNETLVSLQRLVDEMRRNPKKYFKVDVF